VGGAYAWAVESKSILRAFPGFGFNLDARRARVLVVSNKCQKTIRLREARDSRFVSRCPLRCSGY
jgi:hypothetical protein